jgi:hypothetical protein
MVTTTSWRPERSVAVHTPDSGLDMDGRVSVRVHRHFSLRR